MANEQQRKSLCSQVTEGSLILAWTATGEIYKIFCKVLNWNWMKSDAEINKASSCRLPSDHLLFDIQNLEKVPPALSWRKEKLDIHQETQSKESTCSTLFNNWFVTPEIRWINLPELPGLCHTSYFTKIQKSMTTLWPHRHIMTSVYQSHQNHQIKRRLHLRVLTNLDSLEQSTEAQHQSVIDLTFRKPKTHQNSSKLYTPRSTGGTGGTISVVSGSSKRWGVDGSGSWVFCSRVSWSVANCHLMVSINGGTPKSSTLIGFSLINHPFWGTPIYGNPHLMASSKSNGGTLLPGSGSGASASSCSCCGGFFGAFLPPQQPMARRVQTKSSLICRNAKEYLKVQFAKFIRISPSCIDCQVHWFSALISFLGMSWAFTFL